MMKMTGGEYGTVAGIASQRQQQHQHPQETTAATQHAGIVTRQRSKIMVCV